MPRTIIRQVETRISLAQLRTHAITSQPLTLSIGPIPNSKGDEEVCTTIKTVILSSFEENGAGTDLYGKTRDNESPVTLTWSDTPDQDLTIEFTTNS